MASASEENRGFERPAPRTEIDRLRARAALALAVASVSVGFIVGRASVWLVPFEARGSRVAEVSSASPGPQAERQTAELPAGKSSKPPLPLPPPGQAKAEQPPAKAEQAPARTEQAPAKSEQAPAKEAEAQRSAEARTADGREAGRSPAVREASRAAEPREASPPAPADRAKSPAEAEPARPPVVLINPGAAQGSQSGKRADDEPAASGSRGTSQPGMAAAAGAEECQRRFSSFRSSDGTYQPYGGGPRQRCPLLR